MSPSFHDIRRKRQGSTFFGHTQHRNHYRANLSRPDDERWFIYYIHGNAGVGKSLLLQEFRRLADQDGALIVHIDEEHTNDPIDILSAIVTRLDQHGVDFKNFTKQHTQYLRQRHELLSDKNAPQSITATLTKGLVHTGVWGARLAGAGSLTETIKPAQAAETIDEALTYIKQRFTEPKILKLMLDPVGELTRTFTQELNKGLNSRMLALFIDTFEQVAPQVHAWLLRLLSTDEYGDFPGEFVLTIAGQDQPDANAWSALGGLMVDIELEPFTRDETVQLLHRRGVIDPEITNTIWNLTGGLPVLVDSLAQASPSSASAIVDPGGDQGCCKVGDGRHRSWSQEGLSPSQAP